MLCFGLLVQAAYMFSPNCLKALRSFIILFNNTMAIFIIQILFWVCIYWCIFKVNPFLITSREEYEAVQGFASGLSVESWVCCKFEMLNRPLAPVLIFLFKR